MVTLDANATPEQGNFFARLEACDGKLKDMFTADGGVDTAFEAIDAVAMRILGLLALEDGAGDEELRPLLGVIDDSWQGDTENRSGVRNIIVLGLIDNISARGPDYDHLKTLLPEAIAGAFAEHESAA
jgi:hypothetical protein